MKQTKESFLTYLAKVRAEAGNQKRPDDFLTCPTCCHQPLTPVDLVQQELTHVIHPYIWKGTFWVYKCPECKEGFTTTQSDTISIASLKPTRL